MCGAIAALIVLAAACRGPADGTAGGPGTPEGATRAPDFSAPLEADQAAKVGGSLVIGINAETNGWNPTVNQWVEAGTFVGSTILEPLFLLDRNGEPKPFLAESAVPNADFTQWDITLKDGISFSNGEVFDGAAAKKALDASANSVSTGRIVKDNSDRFEVTGRNSIREYLKRPDSARQATYSQAWMMAPAMIDAADSGSSHPIGTGPFVFREWNRDKDFRVTKNATYWRKDASGNRLPYLDNIEFRPMPDPNTQYSALRAGDVDMIMTESAANANAAASEFSVISNYENERAFITLNVAEGPSNAPNPFTNVHARRAVALATDRAAIAGLKGPDVQTSSQPWPSGSAWALPEDSTGYPDYNPDKARAEVEIYKRDTGRSVLSFELTGIAGSEDLQVLQALQSQWSEVGIDVKIQAVEQASYILFLAVGKFSAGWTRMFGSDDPGINNFFLSSNNAVPVGEIGFNLAHYSSDSMDAALQESQSTSDQAKRKVAFDRVVREMNDQVLFIWLYNVPMSLISHKRVRGLNSFRRNAFANFAPKPWLSEVWIDQ
ncbi:MAG: ABC transporter substrate-binding protein [Actinobacteria bacterium]|nr:ABC transporter substrate-binding protein [Actinomycetota bacterium]